MSAQIYFGWVITGLGLAMMTLGPVDCMEQMEVLDEERRASALTLVNGTNDDDWKAGWVCDKTKPFLVQSACVLVFESLGVAAHLLYVLSRISKQRGYLVGGFKELVSRALDAKSYIGLGNGKGSQKWGRQTLGAHVRARDLLSGRGGRGGGMISVASSRSLHVSPRGQLSPFGASSRTRPARSRCCLRCASP